MSKQEWIKTSERLPDIEVRVLFYSQNFGTLMGYREARNPSKHKWYRTWPHGPIKNLEYWQPLPEPPNPK